MIFLLFFSIERQISVCLQCSACFFCAILKYIEYKELFFSFGKQWKIINFENVFALRKFQDKGIPDKGR